MIYWKSFQLKTFVGREVLLNMRQMHRIHKLGLLVNSSIFSSRTILLWEFTIHQMLCFFHKKTLHGAWWRLKHPKNNSWMKLLFLYSEQVDDLDKSITRMSWNVSDKQWYFLRFIRLLCFFCEWAFLPQNIICASWSAYRDSIMSICSGLDLSTISSKIGETISVVYSFWSCKFHFF